MVVLDQITPVTTEDKAPIPLGPVPTPIELPAAQQIGEIAAEAVASVPAEAAKPVIKPHEPAMSPNHYLGWTDVSDRI